MMLGIARVNRIGVPHLGQSGTSLFGSVEVIAAASLRSPLRHGGGFFFFPPTRDSH
jgi:hypothetical protein